MIKFVAIPFAGVWPKHAHHSANGWPCQRVIKGPGQSGGERSINSRSREADSTNAGRAITERFERRTEGSKKTREPAT
jgi:hypothetical protein